MYYNGQSNGIRVHHFLNLVHSSMKAKYLNKKALSESSSQATQLQNFFQDLKRVANGQSSNFFDEAILDEIRYYIQTSGTTMGAGFKSKNLFSGRGGDRFERELVGIYEAVWNSIGEDEFDVEQVWMGSKEGNVINLESMLDTSVQKFLEKVGTRSQKKIEQEGQNSTLKQYYLPDVQGKIDVKGYQINIKANASPQMIEIYNLLKDATFSAKNYDSMTWDEKSKQFVEIMGHSALALGKSNIFRSIYGSLSDLGYEDRVVQSAIFAGYNSIIRGNSSVANHFYHLRYMYELMGTGITYNGVSVGHAKYLIYNDPHGNIYVKSTAELLNDVLEEAMNMDKNWDSAISIQKSKFY